MPHLLVGRSPLTVRILHCIPTLWTGSGGPPRSVTALVAAIRVADPNVEIAILSTTHRLTEEWQGQLQSTIGTATLVLKTQFGYHTRAIAPGMWTWLARHGRAFDVVLVHSLFHPTSSGCMYLCWRNRIPYLVMPHGTLSPYTFGSGKTRLKHLMWRLSERRLVDAAQGIICTSSAEAAKVSRLGLRAQRFVVPLPIEPTIIQPGPRTEPVVVYLSRLDRKKNVDVLIEAFAQVLLYRPDARLLLAGSGHDQYEALLRQQVVQLGITRSVEFVGFVEGERKSEILRNASVFVLPSSEENFGVAIIEAMAAAVPVIVSPGVDLAADIEKCGAGVIVPPDPRHLSTAILNVLGDRENAARMGESGRRYIGQALNPAEIGAELLRICSLAARSSLPSERSA